MRIFALWTLLLGFASAEALEFSGVYGSGMVLQRERPIPVRGSARPGATVAVRLGDQQRSATADEAGRWQVSFDPRPASAAPTVLKAEADQKSVRLDNILFGDVFICSGQSNMEWFLMNADGAAAAIADSGRPRLRLFFSDRAISDAPVADAKGRWYVCSPQTSPKFSAVGYFFGRDLEQALDIPVGMINCSRGASSVEAWMSRETLQNLAPETLAKYAEATRDYAEKHKKFQEDLAAFNRLYPTPAELQKAQAAARAAGSPVPVRPFVPLGPEHPHCPGGLYNAQIFPLAPLAVKGVIFYQGEANVADAARYAGLLTTMIADWRTRLAQPKLPFVMVQLPNYGKTFADCRENQWAELREAQAKVAATVAHTGMICAIDLGEPDNLHPRNKTGVGRRLADYYLKHVYGRALETDGPVFDRVRFEGNRAIVGFRHAEDLKSADGEAIRAFQLAGPDRKFQWAEAVIANGEAVVTAKDVPNPAFVRYAWEYSPRVNLTNRSGLPAVPFRTDH